jgi:hypothetical protein
MSYEQNIYSKRLNRFGSTYQDRVQGKREASFLNYVGKSIYKVGFYNNNTYIEGVLTRNKQDDTKTLFRLLVPLSNVFSGGSVFNIKNNNWMVMWLEEMTSSGYNAYSVIKLNKAISWTDRDGYLQNSQSYFFGPMNVQIKDSVRSGSIGSSAVVYREALKYNHLVMPKNTNLHKDDYLVINDQAYVVTGFDWDSTDGVMYVCLDHTYERDLTAAPTQPAGDTSEDFFWLNKGQQALNEGN